MVLVVVVFDMLRVVLKGFLVAVVGLIGRSFFRFVKPINRLLSGYWQSCLGSKFKETILLRS
jgi:hypothetical protein